MNILEKIIARKKEEIALAKSIVSVKELEKQAEFSNSCISLKQSFLAGNKAGIIAEHKRKSPSKGIINDSLSVEFITQGYENAGASALSILTDFDFFGGTKEDLIAARKATNLPILRKDFMIDEYQILEAKAWGADVILLIAANLEVNQLKDLAQFAKKIGLEVLMEVHSKDELLQNINPDVDFIGVNNRNLKTFDVSIQNSLELVDIIPNEFIKIAESGLTTENEIKALQKVGYKGFLIGETFMRTQNPGESCKELINKIKF
ncbi:MAG: indole-3-glycerol phosphate synthase TrpC [Bacteroidetes bacterium]|nr:MAG: indole-3-glycerol phosphate synthase TrpC [Bacteroidota bacterium]